MNLPPKPGSPVPISIKSIIDDRDRIMITLFNHKFLLNQQMGGYYVEYNPLQSDQILSANPGCNFFEMFAKGSILKQATGMRSMLKLTSGLNEAGTTDSIIRPKRS